MIAKDGALTRVRVWDRHGREVPPDTDCHGPRPDNLITRRMAAAEARRKADR